MELNGVKHLHKKSTSSVLYAVSVSITQRTICSFGG